jgi:hypothetical protein
MGERKPRASGDARGGIDPGRITEMIWLWGPSLSRHQPSGNTFSVAIPTSGTPTTVITISSSSG